MPLETAAGRRTNSPGNLALLLVPLLAAVLLAWLAHPPTAGSLSPAPSNSPAPAAETSTSRLCRFGVNDTGGNFDLSLLRSGWYINYQAELNPPQGPAADYTRVIRLCQPGKEYFPTLNCTPSEGRSYDFFPAENDLQAAVLANPGTDWLIGNEPDRRKYQDDLDPAVYAEAYHDLYALIKGQDPTARILAGSIVQPTPARLYYLDLVLDAYEDAYGQPLPADGWSIHGFILNEVSCDYDPGNCWGAGIPPGIDWDYGEVLGIDDNDSLALFKQRIERFRRWMSTRGYGRLPLHLTEYGVLMPADFGFTAARVNAFMSATFDYLRQKRDLQYGYPEDDYRLVQRWSWYSTEDTDYNGWLYNAAPATLSPMGQNYANYVSAIPAYHDLFPVRLRTTPNPLFSTGGPVSLTLHADLANSGNLQPLSGAAVVRLYDGDPANGGSQIGPDRQVNLAGCGRSAIVSVDWHGVAPGLHPVYVVVDADNGVDEGAYEGNNTLAASVLVATQGVYLPLVGR